MPPADDAARNPNTPAEIEAALAYLVGSAREADEHGNFLRYQRRHEQINARITDWLTAKAEAIYAADAEPAPDPTSALLERMPGVA